MKKKSCPEKEFRHLTLAELRSYEPHLTLSVVGDYESTIVVFAANSADVATLLPSNLQLRAQTVTPIGTHPVLLFAGEQRQVRGAPVPGDLCAILEPLDLCLTFLEAAIAIPFVEQVGSLATVPDHFCSVKIYLNQLLPIYLGWLCGFPKIEGKLKKTLTSFSLKTKAGSPLLNLTITPNGPFQNPSTFPLFASLQPMFEQPHIGQLFSLSVPLLSTFVCADIDLKIATCQIQSASVDGTLTPGLTTVLPATFSKLGIDTDPLGAFRLRTTWELVPPTVC